MSTPVDVGDVLLRTAEGLQSVADGTSELYAAKMLERADEMRRAFVAYDELIEAVQRSIAHIDARAQNGAASQDERNSLAALLAALAHAGVEA